MEDGDVKKVDHYVYLEQEMTIGKATQEEATNRRLRLTSAGNTKL